MMSHIISYFVISYLSVFFLYACRNLIIPINKNSDYLLTRVNVLETLHIEDLSNLQMMGYFLGLPLFVVIALSSIQSVFAIQGHAVEGCIVIIVYLLISIYWGEWYLLGNYLMLLRSLDTVNGTFPIGKGLVISLVIIFLSYQIGRSKLNKTDFL